MTGYKGVRFNNSRARPYQGHVWRGGKRARLGTFATAEEAALIIARDSAAQAAAQAVAQAPTVDEELLVLTGEIVEDNGEEYVEVEAYVADEDDNDEAVYAEVCLDNKDQEVDAEEVLPDA